VKPTLARTRCWYSAVGLAMPPSRSSRASRCGDSPVSACNVLLGSPLARRCASQPAASAKPASQADAAARCSAVRPGTSSSARPSRRARNASHCGLWPAPGQSSQPAPPRRAERAGTRPGPRADASQRSQLRGVLAVQHPWQPQRRQQPRGLLPRDRQLGAGPHHRPAGGVPVSQIRLQAGEPQLPGPYDKPLVTGRLHGLGAPPAVVGQQLLALQALRAAPSPLPHRPAGSGRELAAASRRRAPLEHLP